MQATRRSFSPSPKRQCITRPDNESDDSDDDNKSYSSQDSDVERQQWANAPDEQDGGESQDAEIALQEIQSITRPAIRSKSPVVVSVSSSSSKSAPLASTPAPSPTPVPMPAPTLPSDSLVVAKPNSLDLFLKGTPDILRINSMSRPELLAIVSELLQRCRTMQKNNDLDARMEFLGMPPKQYQLPVEKQHICALSLTRLVTCLIMAARHQRWMTPNLGQNFQEILRTVNALSQWVRLTLSTNFISTQPVDMVKLSLMDFRLCDTEQFTSLQLCVLYMLHMLQSLNMRRHKGNCYREIMLAEVQDSLGNIYVREIKSMKISDCVEEVLTNHGHSAFFGGNKVSLPGNGKITVDLDNILPMLETSENGGTKTSTLTEYQKQLKLKVLRVFSTYTWEPVCTIGEAVVALMSKSVSTQAWMQLTDKAGNWGHVTDYLNRCMDPEFPPLTINRMCRSFRNGILLLGNESGEGAKFLQYGRDFINPKIICCKHFCQDFNPDYLMLNQWWNIPTPFFDGILHSQRLDECVKAIVYAMCGRLLYALNIMDHWQAALFILGVAGSGKSTIGNTMKQLFNLEDVAILSSNMEQKFGLECLVEKLIYFCLEVTKEWSMSKAELQSLVTGEDMTIARKNQPARRTVMDIPGMFCGNTFFPFTDLAGSISRRFPILRFDFKVKEPDGDLEAKIRTELPLLLLKIELAYKDLIRKVGNRSLWNCLPTYFEKIRRNNSRSNNPVLAFIESGTLTLNEDAKIPMSVFMNEFSNFCKVQSFRIRDIRPDEVKNSLTEYGFIVQYYIAKPGEPNTHTGEFVLGFEPPRLSVTNTNTPISARAAISHTVPPTLAPPSSAPSGSSYSVSTSTKPFIPPSTETPAQMLETSNQNMLLKREKEEEDTFIKEHPKMKTHIFTQLLRRALNL